MFVWLFERAMTAEQFVDDHTQAIDIAAVIDLLPLMLLRRSIRRGVGVALFICSQFC